MAQRPLSSVSRSHFACACKIDNVVEAFDAAKPAWSIFGTMGSVITSTNDNSIVMGMRLIGKYFR